MEVLFRLFHIQMGCPVAEGPDHIGHKLVCTDADDMVLRMGPGKITGHGPEQVGSFFQMVTQRSHQLIITTYMKCI